MESENLAASAAPLSESSPHEPPPAESPRQRLLRWTLIGLAIAAIAAVIIYQAVTFVSQPRQRRGRFLDGGNQPVGVARIRRGDIRLSLRALGAVTPLTTVTVTTQING